MQGVGKGRGRNLRSFPFSTFPQPIFQHVDKVVEGTLEHEDEQRTKTCKEAVHRERCQGVRLEIAHEELDRKPRGHSGAECTDDCLTSDAVALVAHELWEFQQGGRTDDWSCKQEPVPSSVLVGEADEEPSADCYAGAADPGEEGGGLGSSYANRFPEAQRCETLLGVRGRIGLRPSLELPSALLGARCAAAEVLGGKQDQAVHRQEGSCGRWARKERAQLVLEEQADESSRDRADDQQPGERASGSSWLIWRSRRLRPSPLRMRAHSGEEEDEEHVAVARCVATRKARK